MSEQLSIPTTLGPRIEMRDGFAILDLGDLPIFHGLSVLSRALGEMVVATTRADQVDVHVERQVRPGENPELVHDLGISRVKLCAEHQTIQNIAEHPELFQDQLRAVLGTLQRHRYRQALIPPDDKKPHALIFDFAKHDAVLRHRCVLEYIVSNRAVRRGYLRITIEDPAGRRLDLSSIPHVFVEDLDSRQFIAGSTRIAQTWSDGVRRESERGHHSFVEIRRPHRHLFRQLDKAGLDRFQKLDIHWGDAESKLVLDSEPSELEHLLKRVLLALEDREVRRLLHARVVVRIDCGIHRVHLDISHLGRVLNLSIGAHRERIDVRSFLERMPTLTAVANDETLPLAGIKVFLVHHITAEVIGLIAALRQLGCRDLTCLFVSYAGEPPAAWLESLLDLPSEEFRSLALVHVPDIKSVEGQFRLSSQHSHIAGEERLTEALAKRRLRYVDAMQVMATFAFVQQMRCAEADGEKCLIIEDGGYLAPRLNEACIAGETVRSFVADVEPDCRDERPLRAVLDGMLIGSIEHTRNGYARLAAVQERKSTLAFPAFSIAISRLKLDVESKEVAVSILNAIENVLHACGKILSRRHCLVLGSHGAIGKNLVHNLLRRLAEPRTQLTAVDLAAPTDGKGERLSYPVARAYSELPKADRRRIDLVVGVTGCSVMTGDDLLEWLLEGEPNELMLASGSMKTEEFAELMAFVDSLLAQSAPTIGGLPCKLHVLELNDPMTGRAFGHRYRITWDKAGTRRMKEIVFLANGTPVNFMFYGVPTELIDEVLAELLSVSLGLVRRTSTQQLSPALYAVDHEITARGEDRLPT